MAPRTAPGKNVPQGKQPARGAPPKNAPIRGVASGTGRKAKEKKNKRQRSKLKGWLETKADWAKFDAWAKINAQPRRIPEPEPVVRASKPLAQMKKRIAFLSQPHKQRDTMCRNNLGVSKKALTAKPSKRVLELAMFVVKNIVSGREFPIKISRAALRYKASRRIIEISRPHDFYLSEHCKALIISQDASNRKMTARRKRLALAKKAIECPDLLTDEEIDILMTPGGIYRSALTYKFTPWMNYLSLPSYRFLKYRTDDDANEWKKFILEENDTRGKRALEEKQKKADKKKQREEDARRKKELEEKQQREEDEKTDGEDQPTEIVSAEDKDNSVATAPDEEPEEKVADKSNDPEGGTGDTEQNLQKKESKTKMKNKEPSRAEQREEAGDSKRDDEGTDAEEAAKERKAARNAWRFEPSPCIDNPFDIKRSALKGKVSPRMAELAVPHVHKDRSSRKNPFAVRKSALEGPVPERMTELAKPPHPREPVEKPPPREKDSFGRPIYPMPPYGKKMPKVKPYQPAECPEKNEDDDNDEKKKERKKRRAIDPIVYESTIDPCIDPERAKRQLKARKFAKEEMKRRKEAEERAEKENEPPKPEDDV